MATHKKHNATVISRAGSAEYIDPSTVKIEHGANPRHFDASEDTDEIAALAADFVANTSIFRKKIVSGQQNPATVTRDETGDLLLVTGHRRFAAVAYINERADIPRDKGGFAEDFRAWRTAGYDGPFPIKVAIVDLPSAADRFSARIAENALRRGNGPMDWAKIVTHYKGQGLSDPEIAELLTPYAPTGKESVSPSWVAQMRNIADAPRSLAMLLHRQEIAVSVAIALLRQAKKGPDGDAEEEPTAGEQEAWIDGEIDACSNEAGEFDRAAMAKRLTKTRASTGTKTTRTVSTLKKLLRSSIDACGSTAAALMLGYMEGTRTEEDFAAFLAESASDDGKAAKKSEAKAKAKKTAKKSGSKKTAKKPPKRKGRGGRKGGKKSPPALVAPEVEPASEEPAEVEVEEVEISDGNGDIEIDMGEDIEF